MITCRTLFQDRVWKALFISSILMGSPFSAYSQNELLGIDTETRGDQTQVVIKLSGNTDYKAFALHNPERYVLDISDTTVLNGKGPFRSEGVIEHIRTARRSGEQLRVVFDLNNTASVVHGRRPSRDDSGSEIIVELTGKAGDARLHKTGISADSFGGMRKAVQRGTSIGNVKQSNSRAWSQCKTRRLSRYLQTPVVTPVNDRHPIIRPEKPNDSHGFKEARTSLEDY